MRMKPMAAPTLMEVWMENPDKPAVVLWCTMRTLTRDPLDKPWALRMRRRSVAGTRRDALPAMPLREPLKDP